MERTTETGNRERRLRRHSLAALLLLLVFAGADAQRDTVYCTEADREVFAQYLTFMDGKGELPFDSLLLETASFFLGTPYAGATLEQEPEGLVVNLRALDCFTFVENVIALSRTIAEGDSAFDAYCDHLQHIRYREGKITNYTDRLHYTSDWLYENDRRQILAYDSCAAAGRRPHTFNLHFMSTHPGSYRQLKADTSLIAGIRETEQQINARTSFYHLVPKHEIDTFAVRMQHGDVVCFVTSIAGLDISHVGILTRAGETLTFIHASSVAKEVIVNKESLKEYVEKGKNITGVMTARPLPPPPKCEGSQNISNANFKPIL
jgi:hypothetical protein